MSEQNYGVLIKGASDTITIVITDSSGWNASADDWTWKLLFGLISDRTKQVLALQAASATLSTVTVANDTLTLIFSFSVVDSAKLGEGVYYVECQSKDGSNNYNYYDDVHGHLTARNPDATVT